MPLIRRQLMAAAAAACAWPLASRAAAATRLIVPYPAGGTSDQVARLLAEPLARQQNSAVYVDNKPGASGTLGSLALARAVPDGRTLGIGTISTLVLLPLMHDVGYDPLQSFEPVGAIGAAPLIVVVAPQVPARTLHDLIRLLAAQPGEYNLGSVGEGSLPHVAGELFQALSGTRLTHIPYPGAPAARVDLMAGRVQVMLDQLATFSPAALRDGSLRPLAVMARERMAQLPDVPTVAEAGLPGLLATMWMGLLAPAGTAAAVVNALNGHLRMALANHDVRDAMVALGMAPGGGSAQAFGQFIAAQLHSDFAARTLSLQGRRK